MRHTGQRHKELRGRTTKDKAQGRPELHHEGLLRMRDGLIRRPTASALQYDNAHSGTLKSEEKAHFDHVGLVNMGQGFARKPRTMAGRYNMPNSVTLHGTARNEGA